MILRSRILLPITQPPIDNGAVVISGPKIQWTGKWHPGLKPAGETVVDLGETILLPGLVNAHCHLDYTDMAGQIPPPRSFPDFIKSILALKATWSREDYCRSWLHGADMLLRKGVTTVADIEAVPSMLPEVRPQTPLRLFSFLELISLRNEPTPETLLQQTLDLVLSDNPHPPDSLGLSPHAPYTTTPELLRCCVETARARQWRLCTHVAESQEEFDMFTQARGPMFDWLKNQRNMDDCGRGSPIQYLDQLEVFGENGLAVHVNYLAEGDAQILGRKKVPVAHCPRSHAFFQHRAFPQSALAKAAVPICLGTDSLVTVKPARGEKLELDLFAELQTFAANTGITSPEGMIRMVTVNGAQAIGWRGQVGELSPEAWADLITIPYAGHIKEAYEAVIYHTGNVSSSMIGGQWVMPR